MRIFLQRFTAMLNSRRFFKVVAGFFVLEAAWIALSAVYPQAFDENFHFGLIKIYSHYGLPFLNSQPHDANAFGAVPRDPSYLYQYGMSFPYRLIAHFNHSQTVQVILLRFVNIGFVTTGLVLFRRVMLRAGVSVALTNLSMALFVLIPVVPQVAGQINYDNLLFPLVAWTCLLTMQAADELKRRQPSVRTVTVLASICLLTTQIKYEFMPVFVGVVLYLAIVLVRNFKGRWRQFFPRLIASWQPLSIGARTGLVVLLIVSLGIFIQRDGYNLARYHTFTPACTKVLSVAECSAYGPWYYNHLNHQYIQQPGKGHLPYKNPVLYTGQWIYWLWFRLFFAINGPPSYTNYPPLPLPATAGLLIIITGIVVVCMRWRRALFGTNPYILFFFIITITYLAALWISGYLVYLNTGVLELMNGRYLLPIVVPAVIVISGPLSSMLRRRETLKRSLALLAVIFFIQGGGVFTFILRSDAQWDWPDMTVVHVNNGARELLAPVIIEGSKTYDTNQWFFD